MAFLEIIWILALTFVCFRPIIKMKQKIRKVIPVNTEQLYQKQRMLPFFRPASYEALYNVNQGRKWCIRQDMLYYVINYGNAFYQLCRADLKNNGAKEVVFDFSSPKAGEDFSVLYTLSGIFIYRLLSGGIEIFRWKDKNGVITPLPRQFVQTQSRIIGFDMQKIFCADRGDGSYKVFSLDIENGSRNEIYSAQKELGEVLVLQHDLIIYDYEYDDDSISCPLTNYDFHLVSKYNHNVSYSFDAYSNLVDADQDIIWRIDNNGPAQYLVPLSITSIAMGEKNDERIAYNASCTKFLKKIIYGDFRYYTFNGFTLLKSKQGVVTAYNSFTQSEKILANNCYNSGTAGNYLYVKADGQTKLYLQKKLHFSFYGIVEDIINQ